MLVGVERLAQRVDLLQTVRGEGRLELLLDELDAARRAFRSAFGCFAAARPRAEVVQRGQEVLKQARRGEEPQLLLLADGPAAEVLQVGDGAQVAVVVVGRLLLGGRELLGRIRGAGLPGAAGFPGAWAPALPGEEPSRRMSGCALCLRSWSCSWKRTATQLRLRRLFKFVEQALEVVFGLLARRP